MRLGPPPLDWPGGFLFSLPTHRSAGGPTASPTSCPKDSSSELPSGVGDPRNITDRFAEIGRGPGRPTDPLPAVRYHTKAGERSLDIMRWGIVNLADSARLFPAPLG